MNTRPEVSELDRRNFLLRMGGGVGATALSTLLNPALIGTARAGARTVTAPSGAAGLPSLPHFAPKAKRVISLFMAGGPSHIDTCDHEARSRATPRPGAA